MLGSRAASYGSRNRRCCGQKVVRANLLEQAENLLKSWREQRRATRAGECVAEVHRAQIRAGPSILSVTTTSRKRELHVPYRKPDICFLFHGIIALRQSAIPAADGARGSHWQRFPTTGRMQAP
jgi:hypothetical protein